MKYSDRIKIKLISYTKDPLPTIAYIWWNAKTDKPVPPIKDIKQRMKKDLAYKQEVESLFSEIVDMLIPCSRFINFVFAIQNVTVSWREQLVRHKIGFDYWIQGARVTDQSSFYDNGMFRIPDEILTNKYIKAEYNKHMKNTQKLYRKLKKYGFKYEDIREIMPAGALHRLSFVCNIESLYTLINKRTCWLLQGDLWIPIIDGVVKELTNEISAIFKTFVYPPCIDKKQRGYTGCKFKELALDRYKGETQISCCPIFYFKEALYIEKQTGQKRKSIAELKTQNLWSDKMIKQYTKFWGFNPCKFDGKEK